jgi:ADP-heptose:LPS heptosyltransferase
VRDADRAALKSSPSIVWFDDNLLDFANTAALCECMDVVITVDTSIAHLSGALGRPTWVLLPFNPDWRWMRDRDDSPWCRSAKSKCRRRLA